MTYDQWKTRSPDDNWDYDDDYDDDCEPDECDHEDAELDWQYYFRCHRCGESWRATEEEIMRERKQQAEYDAWCRKEERKEFLRRLTYPIRWPILRMLDRVWPRKAIRILDDTEIPF